MTSRQPQILALAALIIGAIAMGGSVIFVRFADVGAFASAFWRVFLALPFLFIWVCYEKHRSRKKAPIQTTSNQPGRVTQGFNLKSLLSWPIILSGFFFSGDLIFWHLAILNTSVANATFLATTAPVFVILLSGLVLSERAGRKAYIGLVLCIMGGIALVSSSLAITPQNVRGDLFGLITAAFFAGYFLTVRIARRTNGSAEIMFASTLITAIVLFVAALLTGEPVLPQSLYGLGILIALALTAHVFGQGLLAISLGYLPAAFSSLIIFMEAVAAAVVGWSVLGETLNFIQIGGGALIITGIIYARPQSKPRVVK